MTQIKLMEMELEEKLANAVAGNDDWFTNQLRKVLSEW